jgi:large subunit ribosomal protein L17
LITKSKNDTTHSRRTVFSYLQDKEALKTLFGEIAEKVASRNGGYTRIIKLGTRYGDNAELALIELVDYNTAYVTEVEEKTAKTRRSRRGGKKADGTVDATTPVAAIDESSAEVVEETPVAAVAAEPTTEVAEATPAADETPDAEEDKKEA